MIYVGRYAVFDEIASGGFASVHLGRSVGVGGFSRTVAVKRLHRQYARDPEVSAMFLDEAKLVARIRHPNVLPTLDLIAEDEEMFIVMEYVEGVTLRYLMRHAKQRKRQIPLGVTLRIIVGALHGLHAAHEAKTETGDPLQLVHRDVSPDNILVGVDGMPRLLDFGVARALGQFHSTREGEVKGKLAYITPEQVRGDELTRRSDIFSASVVLWEAITGQRLFAAKSIAAAAHSLLTQRIGPPSEVCDSPKKLDGIVLQGLEREPDKRWANADRMAAALEAVGELASVAAVARYVRQAGAERLARRHDQIMKVEAAKLDSDRFVVSRTSSVDIDIAAVDRQRARAVIRAKLESQNDSADDDDDATDPPPGAIDGATRAATRTPDGLSADATPPQRRPPLVAVAISVATLLVFVIWFAMLGDGASEEPSPAASVAKITTTELPATGASSAAPAQPPTAEPEVERAPATSASAASSAPPVKPAPKVQPPTKPKGHPLYRRN
jgi:serine/threonine-protein kinase